MPPRELGVRSLTAARRLTDRWRVQSVQPRWYREQLAADLSPAHPAMRPVARALGRAAWADAHQRLAAHVASRQARFVVHPALRGELIRRLGPALPDATVRAIADAARVSNRTYDLLGYHGLRFDTRPRGDIDWHFDPVSGRRAPRECWTDVRYLDPSVGDHKIIWELNRHQHWLTLGRGWWLAGDARFRDAFVSELESWLLANPPLLGINWASALELGLRSLSWVWALELFADESLAPGEPPWIVDLLLGLERQLRHVEGHLSRYFSPNTHLLGEALALYVCGTALPELRRSPARVATGRAILLEESTRQVLPDGGHAERSPHYHRYALEFYLLAFSVARLAHDSAVLAAVKPVAARMAAFMRQLCDADGRYPLIGDDDGGELAPIAGRRNDARATLGWAAALLDAPELALDPVPDAVTWLTLALPEHSTHASPGSPLRTTMFPESGYLAAHRGSSHLVFDSGPHGYLNGGHAHADALAVTIVARGLPLAIDPGTGTYTVDPTLRDRFRSSAWHNTLTLDGRSQSEPRGPFHWATTAGAEVRHLASNPSFDYAEADTNAWAPAIHERAVLFVGDDAWVVGDRVLGGGVHEAVVRWHLDPAWTPREAGRDCVVLDHPSGARCRLAVPDARVTVRRGEHAGEPGCVSPVYGRFVASHVVDARYDGPAPFWIVSVLDLLAAGEEASGPVVRTALSASEAGGPVAIVAPTDTPTDVTILRGRAARQPIAFDGGVPGAGRVTTDARAAYARLDARRRLERLCLVEATAFRYDGPGGATIAAADPVPDLAVLFQGGGRPPIVESSAPRRGFTIEVAPADRQAPDGRPQTDGRRPSPLPTR
jgi:hypothetical protein